MPPEPQGPALFSICADDEKEEEAVFFPNYDKCNVVELPSEFNRPHVMQVSFVILPNYAVVPHGGQHTRVEPHTSAPGVMRNRRRPDAGLSMLMLMLVFLLKMFVLMLIMPGSLSAHGFHPEVHRQHHFHDVARPAQHRPAQRRPAGPHMGGMPPMPQMPPASALVLLVRVEGLHFEHQLEASDVRKLFSRFGEVSHVIVDCGNMAATVYFIESHHAVSAQHSLDRTPLAGLAGAYLFVDFVTGDPRPPAQEVHCEEHEQLEDLPAILPAASRERC